MSLPREAFIPDVPWPMKFDSCRLFVAAYTFSTGTLRIAGSFDNADSADFHAGKFYSYVK